MRIQAALGVLAACASLIALSGCSDEATAPPRAPDMAKAGINHLAAEVRQLTAAGRITPMERGPFVRPALVQLGQALAFDKILSGNRDIACMTCHLPALGTGDLRSLSIGQGATGLGASRVHPQNLFIPRNAPPLFNLHENKPMFWDGRIFQDADGVFHTPAGLGITSVMVPVFEFGTISMLPMFPVLSREEMRAFQGNELAAISDTEQGQIWEALMVRLRQIPEYRRLFEQAYPGQRFDGMNFAHASNAIAGFLLSKLAFSNSPWDRFLAGDDGAMTTVQLQGAKSFMGPVAKCASCHSRTTSFATWRWLSSDPVRVMGWTGMMTSAALASRIAFWTSTSSGLPHSGTWNLRHPMAMTVRSSAYATLWPITASQP
jgi:cytochrome c peroxidase